MNLIDVHKQFATDEQCLAYLEQMRWPSGVRCVTCGNDKLSKVTRDETSKGKNKRTTFYQCLEPTCRQQFSPTAGTIFHDSHLPLHKWFLALALIVDAKKGVSAKQLQRHLGIGSYRTAWYLAHRIRKAMEDASEGSLLSGTVEVDETYIGGKTKRRRHGTWGVRGRGTDKPIVIGIRQRQGGVRFFHAADVKSGTLAKYIKECVSTDVEMIVTDNFPIYDSAIPKAGHDITKHKRIKHISGVYVQGDIHTNTVESAFSLLKRGILGSFHKISAKHLGRYLAEFEYRFNRRDDGDIFEQTMARMAGVIPMPYAELIGKKDEAL